MIEPLFSLAGKRVWVAGHKGMVGSALIRRLRSENCEILTVNRTVLDLCRQDAVENWVTANRPNVIFLAAAKVGGILANASHPADFLHDNLAIQTNVMEAARQQGATKLMLLGSVCIYPKMAPQPVREDSLLTGPLEPTNEWYAIAKIAGLKMAQAYRRQYGCDFISAMPANLYGPEDNFDLAASHVLPAMIRKCHEAKLKTAREIVVWGSGTPRREFLHVDDCADALVFLMQHYSGEDFLNVGTGQDITTLDLAHLVADIVGYDGTICTDPSRPDGTPSRLMSTEKLTAMGWRPRISLKNGIASTYQWFLNHIGSLRGA
jgi:GDP-L-fucose synthase